MAEKRQKIDPNTLDRIATSVRWSEGYAHGVGSQYAQYQPLAGMGMWAQIQDPFNTTDFNGNPITLYSWEQYFPARQDVAGGPGLQPDNGNQGLLTGLASGNDFAMEVKGCRSVPYGTLVWLRPSLVDKYFVFEWFQEQGCWAVLSRGTDPFGTAYSWQLLQPMNGGGFAVNAMVGGNWLNPTGYAREIQGSPSVLSNERVWLTKTADFYTFYYSGGVAFCNAPTGGIGPGSSEFCIVNTTDSILVYNPWAAAVTSLAKISIAYSTLQGSWYAIGEECPDDEED